MKTSPPSSLSSNRFLSFISTISRTVASSVRRRERCCSTSDSRAKPALSSGMPSFSAEWRRSQLKSLLTRTSDPLSLGFDMGREGTRSKTPLP